MPRRPDPETAEKHRLLCEAFEADPTLTNADLGKRFRFSTSSVNRILSAAGLISAQNRRRIRPLAERKKQGTMNKALGAVVAEACYLIEHDGSGRKPSDVLGYSPTMITEMKGGYRDFTILELEALAKYYEQPVSEIVRKAESLVIRL